MSKLRAALSLSMLMHLFVVRPKCNWWLAERTPLRTRLRYWLLAPHRLCHGVDGYLYTRLRHLINCHPRYWSPRRSSFYGAEYLTVGPVKFVWGKGVGRTATGIKVYPR